MENSNSSYTVDCIQFLQNFNIITQMKNHKAKFTRRLNLLRTLLALERLGTETSQALNTRFDIQYEGFNS